MIKHIMVRQPQDANPERLDVSLPSLVSCLGSIAEMAVPVHLDGQPGLGAIEVEDVGTDAVLASELEPVSLSATQSGPQDHFGARHFTTQGLARVFLPSLVECTSHGLFLFRGHPPLSPLGEGG